MKSLRELQQRLECAATLRANFWVATFAIALGGAVAWALIHFLPTRNDDVATARTLGIVSETILAGHSKSTDSLAYGVGLPGAVLVGVSIWTVWALRAGRNCTAALPASATGAMRMTWIEFAIATVMAFALFARIWNGRAATFSAWSALSEEGEMLAWVDTVLRGGALSRDTFCLYGPLSVWLVAALFALFQPSIGLWRCWIFGLNALALIAIYFLLRAFTRTRLAAAAGTIGVGALCAGAVPAMSWSLARVGLGLAAIAALNRALDHGSRSWHIAAGALAAGALLYSPEAGTSCAIAIALVLLLSSRRWFAISWTALGAAIVFIPAILYLVGTHSLAATFDNMARFSRVRLLGFGALVFPRFQLTIESLRAYFAPAVLAVSTFVTATKLLRGWRDARVLTETALIIFGVVLFNAAVSRPDDIHLPFVLPPVLILLSGLLEEAWFAWQSPNYRIVAPAALAIGLASLLLWTATARENIRALLERPAGRVLALPRGGNALFPEEFANGLEQITRAIQSRTAPNEPFWIFPNEALLYFLADRPQPTRFPLAIFAVTREQREQLIADLERTRPRWAVVYRDAPLHDRIPHDQALPEVVAYLSSNYQLDQELGNFALLRRKD